MVSATGHKSGAVFEVYADHASEKVFQEVSAAALDTFGKLIVFPSAGATAWYDRGGRGSSWRRPLATFGLPGRTPVLRRQMRPLVLYYKPTLRRDICKRQEWLSRVV